MEVGQKAPHFEAFNQYGEKVKLSDFENQKIIIFFYPKANTPGCTAESCSLRDGYEILQEKGFQIIGISADSVEKQLRFSDKYHFPFPLLADTDKQIIIRFGVWGQKKFMGKTFDGIIRKTFILDENHTITHIIDKVKTKNHTEQILELLEQN